MIMVMMAVQLQLDKGLPPHLQAVHLVIIGLKIIKINVAVELCGSIGLVLATMLKVPFILNSVNSLVIKSRAIEMHMVELCLRKETRYLKTVYL